MTPRNIRNRFCRVTFTAGTASYRAAPVAHLTDHGEWITLDPRWESEIRPGLQRDCEAIGSSLAELLTAAASTDGSALALMGLEAEHIADIRSALFS